MFVLDPRYTWEIYLPSYSGNASAPPGHQLFTQKICTSNVIHQSGLQVDAWNDV
jgi:hypothetical protein